MKPSQLIGNKSPPWGLACVHCRHCDQTKYPNTVIAQLLPPSQKIFQVYMKLSNIISHKYKILSKKCTVLKINTFAFNQLYCWSGARQGMFYLRDDWAIIGSHSLCKDIFSLFLGNSFSAVKTSFMIIWWSKYREGILWDVTVDILRKWTLFVWEKWWAGQFVQFSSWS